MTRGRSSFDDMIRGFREATATPADGAATRARVLAGAGRTVARHAAFRRTGPVVAVALLVLSSVSAAVTLAGRARRGWAPARIVLPPSEGLSSTPGAGRAVRVIPPLPIVSFATLPPAARVPAPSGDPETRAYAAAHRTHFVDDAPLRALAAWNAYLAAFPRGVFAPEAAYNRAVCLVRLGRRQAAARALRPFADGTASGYRREEARALLAGLEGRWPADDQRQR